MPDGERLTDPGGLLGRLGADRELRRQAGDRGMTQIELAEAIGVSDAMLGFWENGKRDPNYEQLQRWLEAMGKPIRWADDWVDFQVEERIMEIIGPTGRPKPGDPPKPTRAIPQEDLDGLRWSIRKVLRGGR